MACTFIPPCSRCLQHAETKHAHLEGDIHASGAAAAGHQGGGHKAGSTDSCEEAQEGPTSVGAGARGASGFALL